MFFELPYDLLFSLGALALLVIYLLRRKAVRHYVAALFLWDQEQTAPATGRRLRLARLPWQFFLECVVIFLLALAAALPFLLAKKNYPPLVAVLDNSLSMNALQPSGNTARDLLVPVFQKAIQRFPGRPVHYLLAGTQPVRLDEATTPSQAREAWTCLDGASDLHAAIALARATFPNAEILVLTDHAPSSAPAEEISWESRATPRGNLALHNIRRSGLRVLVEVANHSETAATVSVRATPGTVVPLQVPAQGTAHTLLTLPQEAAGQPVQIHLEHAGDALPIDDEATLLDETRPPLAYRIAPGLPEPSQQLLYRTLERNIDYVAVGATELLIGPPDAPAGEYHRLLWHARDATVWSRDFVMSPGNSALLRSLGWNGLRWPLSPETHLPGEVLVRAGEVPLISLKRRDTWLDIHLNLAPDAGNLPKHAFWPSLFWNISDELRSQRPGPLHRNWHAGQSPRLHLPPGENSLTIRSPQGKKTVPFSPGTSTATIDILPPGLHTLAAGKFSWPIAVLPIAPTESDLTKCATISLHAKLSQVAGQRKRGVASLFFLAAIVFLCLEQYIMGRTRGRKLQNYRPTAKTPQARAKSESEAW
ncbi:MAG: VWA domain-containing protein [Victivallales bacterium]|nr:VWA domain-containing protein [Victivallales bacterium]